MNDVEWAQIIMVKNNKNIYPQIAQIDADGESGSGFRVQGLGFRLKKKSPQSTVFSPQRRK